MTLKRARIDNQVLIKNYNFSEFLGDVDSTIQDCQNYMMARSELNCFPAYIIDFTWKIIQVKLAFMVRNLNFKVKNDFKNKDQVTSQLIKSSTQANELKVLRMQKTIDEQEEKLKLQKTAIE